jgi:RNAse (barnase) inhibitor barstar
VKVVRCDLAGCATSEDVYAKILAGLQAPDWHGRNLDALWDSVTGVEINGLSPPYRVEINGYGVLQKELRDLVDRIEAVFLEAWRDRQVDVAFAVVRARHPDTDPV